jgi:4-hydroxy-2-oxoheptanedioate aldolase
LRYPPKGQRSFGPTRASFAMRGYGVQADEAILAFAMIETAEGMQNLEEIAATPGLDGIYVGPADLTLALTEGRSPPGFDREEEELMLAVRKIADVCRKNGIYAALHCGTADYAAKAIGWGFSMTTVSGDSRLLAAAAAASVSRFRELTGTGAEQAEKGAY